MRFLLYPFLGVSLLGLLASLVVHIGGWTGLVLPDAAFWALHIGVFVVAIPAMLVMFFLVGDTKMRDQHKAILLGCPKWMRRSLQVLGIYTITTFFVALLLLVRQMPPQPQVRFPPRMVVACSAAWMAFYGNSFAYLFAALRLGRHGWRKYCPAGHPLSLLAKFCEECGAPVSAPPAEP